jgi:hypothetical protein
MRRCGLSHRQARACMRAAACARVCCSVRGDVRTRRYTTDAGSQLLIHRPFRQTRLAAGGKLSLASLAVLAPAPQSAVAADGGAPAVHACAPHSDVLADAGAPAVLALVPLAVVLADGGTPAVLEATQQSLHVLFCRLCSQMEAPPQSLHALLCRLCVCVCVCVCFFLHHHAPGRLNLVEGYVNIYRLGSSCRNTIRANAHELWLRRHRIVVSTPRCGRGNPGSNPGGDIKLNESELKHLYTLRFACGYFLLLLFVSMKTSSKSIVREYENPKVSTIFKSMK